MTLIRQSLEKTEPGLSGFEKYMNESRSKSGPYITFAPKLSSYQSMADLAEAGRNLEPRKRIWGDFILEKSLTWFPSEAGSGKTFFMMELCLMLQNEIFGEWLGEPLELAGNSLYINAELSEESMMRRLAALTSGNGHYVSKNPKYKAMMLTTRRTFSESKEEIIGLVHDLRPVLVVIDNFKMCFRNLDSDKGKDANSLMAELLNLRDTYGFAIVVVDHTRKGSRGKLTDSDLQSGSGSKTDLADSAFFLRRSCQSSDLRIIKRSKDRDTREQKRAKLLRFNSETLWFEHVADDIDESIHVDPTSLANAPKEDIITTIKLLISEQGKSVREVEQLTGISKSSVQRMAQSDLPF